MPCKTVTVEGPSITGEVQVSNISLQGGEEQFGARITVENTAGVNATADVVITGDVSNTKSVSLGPNDSQTIAISGSMPVEAGGSAEVEVCADVDKSSVQFG